MTDSVLEVKQLSKTYPGVNALRNVDLAIHAGEVHCLLGENGAGKSTLIKILAGAEHPDGGAVLVDGKAVQVQSPSHARSLGLSFMFQELNIVPQLDVAANVSLGLEPRRAGFLLRRQERQHAHGELKRLGIDLDPITIVGTLTVAEQQLIEIARAVSTRAKVVVMDEPTASLTAHEIAALFHIIRDLRADGVAVVYVSHRLNEVFEIGDRATVLRDGELVATVDLATSSRDEIVSLMVGRELSEVFPKTYRAPGDVMLEINNVSAAGTLDGVSFSVRAGEVVGLAGLAGAGRTETARAIFGADPVDSGSIVVRGTAALVRSPRDAIDEDLGLVPEERRSQGIVGALSVQANIALAAGDKISVLGMIRPRAEAALAQEYAERLRVKTPSNSQLIRNLSGGNQQKCVVAKMLASGADILILDEPTRGIDVGAKAEIFALIDELAGTGVAVLMISSELEEIIGMADRVLVMNRGRITAELAGDEINQETIMHHAVRVPVWA